MESPKSSGTYGRRNARVSLIRDIFQLVLGHAADSCFERNCYGIKNANGRVETVILPAFRTGVATVPRGNQGKTTSSCIP